jgi:hypothetical protein
VRFLRQNTAVTVTIGPVTGTDGLTPQNTVSFPTQVTVNTAVTGYLYLQNGASVVLSAGAISSWTAVGIGSYSLGLTAADVNFTGRLRLIGFTGTTDYFDEEFHVLSQVAYDSLFAGANPGLPVNTTQIAGQTTIAAGAVTFPSSVGTSVYAGADTSGTTSLLARLTTVRSGYLDNLNAGGVVASHADVLSLNTATGRAVLVTSGQYLKPASSTLLYPMTLILTNLEGVPEDADGAGLGVSGLTTIVVNGVGTDRSANFSGWTHAATGRYEGTYSVASGAADEPLVLRITGTVGGQAFVAVAEPVVADAFALAFNSTDRTTLNALATGVTLAASQPNYAPLTTLGATAPANWINTLAFAAGAKIPGVALADALTANNDKTGYALSAAGLDVVTGFGAFSARRTIQAMAALLFGVRSGVPAAGVGGTITFAGSYGTVTVDAAGDITTSSLTPPA